MNKIGVNIDLSVFFEDERKMVLVLVDPKWESVECLQKRVEFLFDVDLVRFLNSDGCFLPPQEPIEIIKFCKGLKAFVPKESLEKRKKKKSKKAKKENKSTLESDSEEVSIYNNEYITDTSQKKRKYNSLQSGFSATSSRQSAKRLKNCIAVKEIEKSSEISSTSEQIPPLPFVNCKKSDDKESKSSSVISDNEERSRKYVNSSELSSGKITVENEAENSSSHEGNYHSKRSRTSTPKEKGISEIIDNVKRTFDDDMKERPLSIHSSTLINGSKIVEPTISRKSSHLTTNKKNPFKGKSLDKNKGHIYFNEANKMIIPVTEPLSESTIITENETKKPQTITNFRCLLNDVSTGCQKPRIFQINSLSKSPKKQLVEIQEEIIIQPKALENYINESLERTDNQHNNTTIQTVDTLQTKTKDTLTAICQDKIILNDTATTEITTIGNSEPISMENTDTTIVVATDQTSTSNLGTIRDQSNPDDSLKNKLNESSVLSIDSVDLSIVIDDEEDDESKNKKHTVVNKKEQSHDLTEDDGDSSDVLEISDIIDLNETEDNCDSTVNTSSRKGFHNSTIVVHKVLPFCRDMVDLPNIGDVVVFKIPYINKKLKSSETNFIAGIVEYINKRTKTIKLLIKDGLAELCYVPSKFVSNLNESQDQDKYLQLKLSDMLEPKFYSRS